MELVAQPFVDSIGGAYSPLPPVLPLVIVIANLRENGPHCKYHANDKPFYHLTIDRSRIGRATHWLTGTEVDVYYTDETLRTVCPAAWAVANADLRVMPVGFVSFIQCMRVVA